MTVELNVKALVQLCAMLVRWGIKCIVILNNSHLETWFYLLAFFIFMGDISFVFISILLLVVLTVVLMVLIQENTPKVTNQAKAQDGPVASVLTQSDSKVTVERDLVSQAEEEDMEALLGTSVLSLLLHFFYLIFFCLRDANNSYSHAVMRSYLNKANTFIFT